MITISIVVITCIISFAALQDRAIMSKLIFNPYLIHQRNEWYRFFSSGLIHADFIHLLVNMLVLYSFGIGVERNYGSLFDERGNVYFIILYVSSLLFSILPTYNNHKHDPGYNGLGASGAVSAILFASILLNPMHFVYIYGIIGIPGIIFGGLYLYYCYYMGKRGGDNINHSAHMWGAIYGFTFTLFFRPSLISDFFNKLINFRDAL